MFTSHQIKVERTAHYYTLGQPGPDITQFWIVCHGYGQLASNLIRKFSALDDGKTFILSPEGLSRFYWKGLTGDVAASWMTKGDRLDEIADYSKYLSQVYRQYRAQLPENVKINFLGFSQGVATQIRWIMNDFPEFDNLILWAGLLPEDLDYRPQQAYFSNKSIYFVYGDEDQFITPKRIEWHNNFAQEQGISYQTHTFSGRHEIDRDLLGKISQEL